MRPWVRGYRQLALAFVVIAVVAFGCRSTQQRKDDGPADRSGNDTMGTATPDSQGPTFAGIWEIDPQWLEEHLRDVQLLDVREEEEFQGPLGDIQDAIHIP